MFPRRRRYGGGLGRGSGGIGLFLLAFQFLNLWNVLSRTNEFLPVTLATLALNVLMYLQPGRAVHWPSVSAGCISVRRAWFDGEWKRVFLSPFLHASDWHLYYNMASFMWKAVALERHYGSGYFAYMIAVFSMVTGVLYMALNFALAEVLGEWSYINSCAVGFSGVIFALKVVAVDLQPRGVARLMGFVPIPMKYAVWAELLLVSVLFPNVSFVGHLAGVLVGVAFVYGPLQTIMDLPLPLLSGLVPVPGEEGVANRGPGRRYSYNYAARATGHRPPNGEAVPHHRMPSDGRPAGGAEPREDEEENLQEAIRRSLDDPPTSTAGLHGDSDEDPELQQALEQSIPSAPPLSHDSCPPSYNPEFTPTADPQPASADVIHGEAAVVEGTSVRRRNVGHVPLDSTADESGGLSREQLRAARLQRFGREPLSGGGGGRKGNGANLK